MYSHIELVSKLNYNFNEIVFFVIYLTDYFLKSYFNIPSSLLQTASVVVEYLVLNWVQIAKILSLWEDNVGIASRKLYNHVRNKKVASAIAVP